MKALALMVLLAAKTDTAKIFSDKGSSYFRTDNKKALTVGAELVAVADPAGEKPAGKAVIMEVSGSLARVSLDDDAAKAGAKFVVVPKVVARAGNPAPVDAPRPVVAAAPAVKLQGKLESGALRFTWSNDSDASWTQCRLEYSDGRFYDVGEVVKHTDDAVMKVKFSSPPEPAYDHLTVACAEGKSDFYFGKPAAPVGSLKGYATNEGRGSVVVFNQNETAWTSCDVRKPDGTHFVLGNLKGHQSDSIDRGRFVKEEDASPKWIELRCKEGELRTRL